MRLIRYKMIKKAFFLWLVGIVVISSFQMIYAGTNITNTDKNILFLNSYHKGFKWTDQITDTFLSQIENSGLDPVISIEYMDWKRYPSELNLWVLFNTMQYKYERKKIDLIVVTDYKAFEFALMHRDEIFSSAPIVFAGVNERSFKEISEGYTDVTGIIEKLDYDSMIRDLLVVSPNLEEVYLIYDFTESGLATGFSAQDSLFKLKPELNVSNLNGLTHDELIDRVSEIEGNAAIIFLAYTTDIIGRVVEPEFFSRILSESARVPIVAKYDFHMNYGVLGGSMVSCALHGERIGEMATRILKGENVNDIPIISEPLLRTVYDYEQLKRFNVPIQSLPPGTEIINKPFSFFETYRFYVLATSGVLLLLAILLVIISIFARRLKLVKDDLQESYQELMQVHEELVASDEELRSQFDELTLMTNKLQESEEKYRLALDATNDAIIEWDIKNDIFVFSGRWEEITGYSQDEMMHFEPWQNIIHKDDHWRFVRLFTQEFTSMSERDQFPYRIKLKSGEYKWIFLRRSVVFDQAENPVRLISAHSDIDQIKKAQEKLEYVANHDFVTGLRNRRALVQMLEDLMSVPNMMFGLIFMDIDNFKMINNSMGHSFGDLLLKDIGMRMIQIVSEDAEIFSIGGANFAVMQFCENSEEINVTINNLKDCFSRTFESHGVLINMSFSMGVAMFPQNACSVEELLRSTDIAMNEAKRSGKGQHMFFGQLMKIQLMERMILEKNLREALGNGELALHYQPQLCLKTGRIKMLEALLRWYNPQLGNVSPMQFIKLAEESHLIVSIGEWVIDRACSMLARIHKKGHKDTGVSINISFVQLIQENFTEYIKQTIEKHGLSPEFIELEITESMFMESLELINERLMNLTKNGMRIALDDFGKGYSSLNYLKQMPMIKIKIDKSFLDEISNKESTIVDYIVLIGKRMGKEVLAEGVETYDQFEYMLKNGCDDIQGYLLSKPMPEEQTINFVEDMGKMTLTDIVEMLKKKEKVS